MKISHRRKFTGGAAAAFFISLTALEGASPPPAPSSTAAPVASPAAVKPGPPAESAVKVTLISFIPMAGTPGSPDFKIATLTFKIEANTPVPITEISFYADSSPFAEGSEQKTIPLLIHTGIFLGPPGTKVDPGHPIQRTVWLKSQENLHSNWLQVYSQTENATFRWTIGGQPTGGSIAKPLHKAWP
jgi:hypothetical protein